MHDRPGLNDPFQAVAWGVGGPFASGAVEAVGGDVALDGRRDEVADGEAVADSVADRGGADFDERGPLGARASRFGTWALTSSHDGPCVTAWTA